MDASEKDIFCSNDLIQLLSLRKIDSLDDEAAITEPEAGADGDAT